ncbi:MAG: hypothetical protein V1906_01465 [Candidatus Woesearchaeota archaeon]
MTLTYDELKLGESAKQAFFDGKGTDHIAQHCPVYLNTRPFFANLNVTDAAIAAAMAGLNLMLVGDTGCGKSQLASDMSLYYFGGNKADNGHSVWVKGRPDLDVNVEVFTKLNMEKGCWDLTDSIDSLLYVVDEINRCPPIAQNQFFGMGDGKMDHNGRAIKLGRDGYSMIIATANLGNGEFGGTFESDKALYNRMHVAIDFDHPLYRPTTEDMMILDMLRAADPKIKDAPRRDISDKLVAAKKSIDHIVNDELETEDLAALNFLKFGLDHCTKYNANKGKEWPTECQECGHNKNSDAICSMIRAPARRTIESTIRYAAALYLLANLKDPNVKVNFTDAVFKAFEVTGAYQQILNEQALKFNHGGQNPKMMAEVVEALRTTYKANEDFIIYSIQSINDNGKPVYNFAVFKEEIGDGDTISMDVVKKRNGDVKLVKPFHNNGLIGMGWVRDLIDLTMKIRHSRKK